MSGYPSVIGAGAEEYRTEVGSSVVISIEHGDVKLEGYLLVDALYPRSIT